MNARSARPPDENDASSPHKAEAHPIHGPRSKLLYERYGVLENPFGVTPNPRYFYPSRTHAEATASLTIGIECGLGFQALIAPPGMGKTTILFSVLEQFKDVARTAFLCQLLDNSSDLLRSLIAELGGEAPDSDQVRMQKVIDGLLVREQRAGRPTIVIIDEAQNLSPSVLETVRLLSNFETPSDKLLHIILAGQPQLAHRLADHEMAQLRQRISILTTLVPFGLADTRNYIEHRLMIASYKGPPLFTSAALTLIWQRSGGIPREINRLCFNALLLTSALERPQADSDLLCEVIADLDLDRIQFNSDTPPSGVRKGQPAQATQSENALAKADERVGREPPASNDRIDRELARWIALREGTWSGTATELLAAVRTSVHGDDDWWPQSARALYTHIESHKQILRRLGVDVRLHRGFPRVVSLRRCQEEPIDRIPPSGTSGVNHISSPPMNPPPTGGEQGKPRRFWRR